MKLSKEAYVNKTAMIGHTVIGMVLLTAYLLEWVKGSRTLGYIMLFGAIDLVPIIIDFVLYRQNKESRLIRHIMGVGYSVLYIFTIFTTDSALAFVYAIPMFVVATLFSDIRFCAIIASGGLLSNIIYVIYYAMTVGYAPEDIKDVEIRLACMGLVGVFTVITTWANKKIDTDHAQHIEEQKDKVQDVLDHVLATAEGMNSDIETVTSKMAKLGESVIQIHEAMGEVTTGSNETAESIQDQMQRTEQIQYDIVKVKNSADFIEKSIGETTQVLLDSKHQMDDLASHVEKSMEANSQVLEQMSELSEYTVQMNTIIETITSIANSTGMLALNASIEAARAGEAGRGFAVVATQISGLANQTKSATVNITELIENINKELQEVSEAVNVVAESNRANAESTQTVVQSFAVITEGAGKIGDQSKELLEVVTNLEEANADIVDKIQTISAITEEVSAHSNETYSDCEANTVMVQEITEVVTSLNEAAEKLKSME